MSISIMCDAFEIRIVLEFWELIKFIYGLNFG